MVSHPVIVQNNCSPHHRRGARSCGRVPDVDALRELGLEAGLHLDGRPVLQLLLPPRLLLDIFAAEALARVRARDLGLVALAVVFQAARPLAVAPLVVPPLAVACQSSNLREEEYKSRTVHEDEYGNTATV